MPWPHLQYRRLAAGQPARPCRPGGAAWWPGASYTMRDFPPTGRASTSAATTPTTAPSAPPPAGRRKVELEDGIRRSLEWFRAAAGRLSVSVGAASPCSAGQPGAGYRALRAEIDAAVAPRAGFRLVHPGRRGPRLRGRVRCLAWDGARGGLRQRHRRAGDSRSAASGIGPRLRGGNGLAYRGSHGGRHRNGRRRAGTDRHRADALHARPRRTWRRAGAAAGRPAADPRGHPGASLRASGRSWPPSCPSARAMARRWWRIAPGARGDVGRKKARHLGESPASRSIRPRISVRLAMAALLRPVMPRWPSGWRHCGSTAGGITTYPTRLG